jgi:hypothetical protein
MIHWKKDPSSSQFKVDGEYAYPLSPIPSIPIGGSGIDGMIGVSESLALNSNSILVLERGTVWNDADVVANNIKLFLADRGTGDEISQSPTIASKSFHPMDKKLVLDFDNVASQLPAGHRIDNLEGMSWGPNTKDGNRTLVFVSDSNFNASQETQFLIFEVKEY